MKRSQKKIAGLGGGYRRISLLQSSINEDGTLKVLNTVWSLELVVGLSTGLFFNVLEVVVLGEILSFSTAEPHKKVGAPLPYHTPPYTLDSTRGRGLLTYRVL